MFMYFVYTQSAPEERIVQASGYGLKGPCQPETNFNLYWDSAMSTSMNRDIRPVEQGRRPKTWLEDCGWGSVAT